MQVLVRSGEMRGELQVENCLKSANNREFLPVSSTFGP